MAITVKIFETDLSVDESISRNFLPSVRDAIVRGSSRSHDVQADVLSNSLLELLGTLSEVVQQISNSEGPIPSKLTFTLGIDTNGSVGILSTSASVSQTSSICVEFDLRPSSTQNTEGIKGTDAASS